MPRFLRTLPPLAALGAVLLLMVPGPEADAQILRGHDTSAPVEFSADRIEVQDRADRVVVAGNVQVDQAGLHLTSARLTVAYHDTNGVEIDRLDAAGGVTVTRGNERASGDVGIYDLNRKLITLIGHVALNQGTNRLGGGRLVIDLASGRTTVDGAGAGGAPGTTTTANGRVTGTFKVRQTNGDQTTK
jgi:lipopolysaccharide export system protein LptA